ncbi:hypothetical protein [Andreprevotia lacus]|nr:hypothetical protein [Andreprevotia lacus]
MRRPLTLLTLLPLFLLGLLSLNFGKHDGALMYLLCVFVPVAVLLMTGWYALWTSLATASNITALLPLHRQTARYSVALGWLLLGAISSLLALPFASDKPSLAPIIPLVALLFTLTITPCSNPILWLRFLALGAGFWAMSRPETGRLLWLPMAYTLLTLPLFLLPLKQAVKVVNGLVNEQWPNWIKRRPRHPVDLANSAANAASGPSIMLLMALIDLIWNGAAQRFHVALPGTSARGAYGSLPMLLILPAILLWRMRATLLQQKSAQTLLRLTPQAADSNVFNRRLALRQLALYAACSAAASALALIVTWTPQPPLIWQHCAYYLPALCVLAAPLAVPDFSQLRQMGLMPAVALGIAPFLLPSVLYWQPAEIEFWVINALCIVAGVVLMLRRLDLQEKAPLAFPVGYRSDGMLWNARTPQQ